MTFALCSMVTTTVVVLLDTRSIAPPIPLTIFFYTADSMRWKHTEIHIDIPGSANWQCPHIETPAWLQGLSGQDDRCKNN